MTAAETIRKLKSVGASDELAGGIVEVMEEREENRLVTREFLRAELAMTREALRTEVQGLRAEFHESMVTQTRWIVGSAAALLAAFAGLILGGVYFLLAHYRP
ncbi:MAG TPA: hypothetical protein VGD78_04255 [Chthoniobacterales bacterium]